MATQVVRQRVDSPERWARALDRALAAGLEIFMAADDGERFVTSASQLDVIHRTDGQVCSCAAAVAGDVVCQHRALVRYVLGTLPVVVVHVEELEPAVVDCAVCNGCGAVHSRSGGWQCEYCQGRGRVPVLPVLAVMPAPEPARIAA